MLKLSLGFLLMIISVGCDKEKKECDKGPQDNSVNCITLYAPVCGCDDLTYSNSCVAEASGILDYKEGECP